MNLPYPSMDFVPFDVLTASEMDKMVSNIEYLSNNILDTFYPVGSYYETSNESFDPNVSWGGSWVLDSEGRVTVSQDSGTFSAIGATGGEEKHELTTAELPWHRHAIASDKNGDQSPNTNMGMHLGYFSTSSDLKYSLRGTYASEATLMGSGGVGSSAGTEEVKHNNLQPYVVVKRWHRVA